MMNKKLIITVSMIAGTMLAMLVGMGATPVIASTVCTGDECVVVPDSLQTPLGLATIMVSDTNAVTVQFTPTVANTFVVGIPFSFPPGPPTLQGYVRTSIATSGGLVTIDTVMFPPGSPSHLALPNIAIISLFPPGPPCREHTSGTTVVFTPITGRAS